MIKTISQLRDRFLLRKYMKDEFESQGLRTYFRNRYLINVGMYSYGCFDPQRIAKNTKIGRYCSFARTSYIFNGNHGLDFISLHPYLYNINLGLVAQETIIRNRCTVEDDVWIGHGAIILPSVSVIGRGAVIGAGSVVTKDVPKYAIVCGNPAKIVRYRFSDEVINAIEETRWWELDKIELKRMLVSSKKMIFDPDNFFMKKVDPFS